MKQHLQKALYALYASSHRSGRTRRQRLTLAGKVVMGAALAAGVFGIDTTRAVTYQLFGLLAALIAIAYLNSLRFRAPFSMKRELPAFATAGSPFRYKITLHNQSPRAQASLSFREQFVRPCPSYEELRCAREPGEEHRNRWDQAVLYHRFQWLTRQHTKAHAQATALETLGSNSRQETYCTLTPLRRGFLTFEGALILRPDPLGLFTTAQSIPLKDRLLILPKRYPLPDIQLPGQRKHHPGGIHLASSIGGAHEFRSLREYRPGDPMRMLHWKSVAKTNELIIRENEDEYFVRHALILDTFIDELYSERFETAVSVAASFACSIRTQESVLDLMFVEDQAYCFSAGRGVDHTGKLLEILACASPCLNQSFETITPLVLGHAAQLSGCICILQQWDSERKKLIQQLHALHIPTRVLVITQPGETPTDEHIPLQLIRTENPAEGLAAG